MRLYWLLINVSMCKVLSAIQQPNYAEEKQNQCEGLFHKGWTQFHLLFKKAALEYCCRCHEDKCIYIAFSPVLTNTPVFWAYALDHIEITKVSQQELLKTVKTWYISPSVVEDLLRGKMPLLPPQVNSRPSPATTYILSGVFHLKVKYIHEVGNWHDSGYIRWIAYRHVNVNGFTFEGAVVQNHQEKCKWKWLTLKQLVKTLSKVVFFTKPLRIHLNHEKSNTGPLNINGMAEIPLTLPGTEKIDLNETSMSCVMTASMQVSETFLIPSPDTKLQKTTHLSEREFTKVTKSSNKLITVDEKVTANVKLCSVLIHRTSSGLRRCLERQIIPIENTTTNSPLLPFPVSRKPPHVESDHRTRSPLQLNAIIHYRKYVTQKHTSSVQIREEGNDHFYFFNGKLKRAMNHFRPTIENRYIG